MILLIVLSTHLLMSLLMISMPNLTRREILFGVVVPEDFRSSPEGRRAIRRFRWVVATVAFAGLIAIALVGSRSVPVFLLAPLAVSLTGFLTFLLQNHKLKPFGVQPVPVRVVELGAASERLPWFTWLGVLPILALLAVALYLNAHWDSIPSRFPVHWGLDGNPNRWADRTFRGVYAPLVFGAELLLWLFGFALAIWYGSRRSEPLRRPVVGLVVATEWTLALIFSAVSLGPVIHLPVALVAVGGLPLILVSVVKLIKKSNDPRAPVDPTPNECWKGGMLYNNPNDAALFVARRDSVGFTSNMGNPWSWVMLGSLLVLIAIGFLILR